MKDLAVFVIVLGVWFVANWWVLPRLGFRT